MPTSNTLEKQDSKINVNDDEKAFQRCMLMAYIENSKKMQESQEEQDDTSVHSTDSTSSDVTVEHNNGSNRYAPLGVTKRRSVNNGLDGYKKTPSKHVIFCKAKIAVPESDTPTKKMREAIGKLHTTLLKIDTSVKLYTYMDKTNKTFINNPSQIPETP